MLSLQNIKFALGQSNVKYSSKYDKKILPMMKSIESFAKDNDIFVRIFDKKDALMIQVDKNLVKHVAEVPSYAVNNHTGDAVYLSIKESATKLIPAKDIATNDIWRTLLDLRKQVNTSLTKITR